MSVVVKLGGHALDSLSPASAVLGDLAEDLVQLGVAGEPAVLVHGGGPQISQLLELAGIEGRFHQGLRLTDATTMGFVAMALSLVNVEITAALNQLGVTAVGLSGADASLFRAVPLGEPWGRVGGAPRVRTEVVHTLWREGMTPVASSIAVDDDGALLNCNADASAGALASALRAHTLVLLSDVDQLRADPDEPASSMDRVSGEEARAMLASGAAREGMRPKLAAALAALDAGAARVVIANGARPHALRCALASSIPTTEVVA